MPTTPDTLLDVWCRADNTHCYQDGGSTVPSTALDDPVEIWKANPSGTNAVNNVVHPGLYKPSGINGKAAVAGNGVDAGLNGTFLDGAGDFGVYLVFKPGASVVVGERLIDKNFAAGFTLYRSGTNAWGGYIAGAVVDPPSPVADNAPHILILRRTGTTGTIVVDSDANRADATVPSTALSSDVFSLFYYYNLGTPGNISSALIGEWGVKAGTLSDADITSLISYANSYYFGIGGSTLFRRGNSSRAGSRAARRLLGSL